MKYILVAGAILTLVGTSSGCGGGSASAHTETITTTNLGPAVASNPLPLNGKIVMFLRYDDDGKREPWVSDGTETGTFSLDIHPGPMGSIEDTLGGQPWMVVFQGNGYFLADDGTSGLELWRTNGTVAGTELVADLVPGSGGLPFFSNFEALDDRLVLIANPYPNPGDVMMYTLEVGP
jgi:ELWxxDGT repeat protein